MFNFIKKALGSLYEKFESAIGSIFNRNKISSEDLDELEKILLQADTGVKTTRSVLTKLRSEVTSGDVTGEQLKKTLYEQLSNILGENKYNYNSDIYLMVGINGTGKTTFSAKLANYFKKQGKKVLFVAGDTFRAAAVSQLENWSTKLGIDIVTGKENQDPASVIYAGCEKYKKENFDILIIDTAGRLQNKSNLMKELEKIYKTITKVLPDKKISTLLTIDTMLGQNSFDQAKIFNESAKLDGLVLTKIDGTGKGGIIFSIYQELNVPVAFISFGEQLDQMAIFDKKQYLQDLLNLK